MYASRRVLFAAAFGMAVTLFAAPSRAQVDPLPSWNEGRTKTTIIDFVRKATTEGETFVPPSQRIAVFDNDGTLWAEQPMYAQAVFAMDELKRLAPQHPEWRGKEPFRSFLAGDMKRVAAGGERSLAKLLATTHAGMTTDAFARTVSDWLAVARHPTTGRRYTDMVYQPQIELLAYLRANCFKTFIVSGGGVEFMRVFAEKTYGVPPEQVVGSSGSVVYRLNATGKPELFKQATMEFVDDGPGKPVGINRFIGRRPILAFGNSDGDRQMLEYTAAGDGMRLALIVRHTDGAREWAYDRVSKIGKLDKALDQASANGWTVVDMKTDWKTVFPDQK